MTRRLVLSLFFAAVLAAPADAREVNKEFHRTFDVSPGAVLHLSHGDGDVFLTSWDKDAVQIDVRYRGEVKRIGFGGEMDLEVEFKQDDNSITVAGKESGVNTVGIVFRDLREYVYEIQAPGYVVLDLQGEDGNVTASDWAADIRCRADDGDIRFSRVKSSRVEIRFEDGDVDLEGITADLFVQGDDGNVTVVDSRFDEGRFRLEDGDLVLMGCEGACDIEINDGDVSARRSRLGRIVVRAEDGDIDLDLLSGPELDVDVVTEDGAVRLSLDAAASAAFVLETGDGTIRVNAEGAEELSKREERVTGTVGDGSGQIRLRTDDGDVTLSVGGEKSGE